MYNVIILCVTLGIMMIKSITSAEADCSPSRSKSIDTIIYAILILNISAQKNNLIINHTREFLQLREGADFTAHIQVKYTKFIRQVGYLTSLNGGWV